MYARLSNALLARTNRKSALRISVTSFSSSPSSLPATVAAAPISVLPRAEAAYIMDCGTLTTSMWPPAAEPVMVTATSVVLQVPPPSPPPLLSLSVIRAVLDATSAPPLHPLRMTLSRSLMWYAVTTRFQRSYALGHSTLNFTSKAFVSAPEGAEVEAAVAPSAEGHISNSGNEVYKSDAPSLSKSAESSMVSGTVMLPNAMVFSFKGSPHEFQARLRGANVLVFFYKAVCGPCTSIRSKLIHAVTDHLPMDANNFIHGAGGKKTPAALQSEDIGAAQQQPQPTENENENSVASPSKGSENGHKTFCAPATDEASMATEDKEACELACRTLEDVSKAFPHRMIFLTVDTNENAKLTALHDIRSLPTFIAYRNGRMIGRVEGADEQEVSKLVNTITREDVNVLACESDAKTTHGETRNA